MMKETLKMLSFVIPCYGSEHTLERVIQEITQAVAQRPMWCWEAILVDDCSPDGVYPIIRKLAKQDSRIQGISLAKNFGQHSALMAGMSRVKGEIVVCLDDDGQTPASEVFRLVDALDEDTDVVYASYRQAQKTGKKHSPFRNFGSKVNEWMLSLLLKKPKTLEITSFFAAKRYVIEEVCGYTNPFPYAIGLVLRTTNKIKNVPVIHRAREIGHSGYTLKKLISLWLNGFTAFSVVPLRIATAAGTAFAGLGFLYVLYLIVRKVCDPAVPLGYSSMMAALLIIGGMLMMMVGLLGEYVGRIYLSLNKSPQYVVRETTNEAASN